MNKVVPILFLFVFLFSCNNKEKQRQVALAPKITESKGFVVPKDSIAEPKTIPAGIPTNIKVGIPKVTPTNTNIHPAGIPKVIIVGIPRICTPGKDTFLLPKIIAALDSPFVAGIPETVSAKDMANKDQNPQNFSTFAKLQGLKHNRVGCMLQDKSGNLWFGTYGGVSKYDGKSFTTFTDKEGLANNSVRSILEDKSGNLWFGTFGGVSKYDGKSFTTFTEKEGLANNTVWCILEDKNGNLWFGTDGGGVSKYNGNSIDDIIDGTNLYHHTQKDLKKNKKDFVKSFTNFSDKQGLPNNIVRSIIEDKSGNLWFGTAGGGVSKYDENCVDDIINGTNLYQHTQRDLKRNRKDLVVSFTNYTNNEGLAGNIVKCILEDKGRNLWFGTEGGGVSKYDGKSFVNFTDKEGLANNSVFSILEDKSGNLWFGTYGGGVSKFDGNCVDDLINRTNLYRHTQQALKENKKDLIKTFTTFTDKEGLSNNSVLSMLEDKNGNLWLGTYGGGVSKYDGRSFNSFTDKEGLTNSTVLSILEDKSGNLWFGTYAGVCKYDGKTFTAFTNKEGLADNTVLSMLEDKSGNLWFGTDGGGVSKYDGNCVDDIVNGTNLYQHTPRDLKKSKKELVKSFTTFTNKEGLANNTVWSIIEDKSGNIWFGTYGGVSRYNGNCVDDLINGTNLYQHTQQDLLMNKNALVKSFINFTDKEGLGKNTVWSILEDKSGNLWFGKYGGGVSKLSSVYLQSLNRAQKPKGLLPSFTTFTDKEGLTNNTVWSILEDKSGNLWFGTDGGGVSRYNGNCVDDIVNETNLYQHTQQDYKKNKKDRIKTFINFTDKEGLANNTVMSIIEDKSGNLWFGTRFGISKLSRSKLVEIPSLSGVERNDKNEPNTPTEKDIIFKSYTYTDGFLGMGVNGGKTMLQATDGTIWIGANDRLTAMHSENMPTDTIAPNIQLSSLELFNENISWINLENQKDSTIILGNGVHLSNFNFDGLTNWNTLPENLSLAYNNNYLTFNFIGITMSQPKKVKYQYILVGMDKNWSAITNKTSAPYGNLPHGTYIFKVKAMNSEGYWSKELNYRFIIRPPWWKTWWFNILLGFIVVGSVVFYIKWREQALKERQRILEQMVVQRTAELVEEKKIVEEKNVLVEAQKHLIEEKHKEITDSINYAERIQRALLASKKLLDENLTSTRLDMRSGADLADRDYFILFKPKDVVSGDFYWATKTVGSGGVESFMLVTADSTGHGVPGAIMSIVNIASLKEASLKGITRPDLLLNETRRLVIENLKNDGSAEGGRDGMDGSLLSFDFKNNTLSCASANSPIWIIRSTNSSVSIQTESVGSKSISNESVRAESVSTESVRAESVSTESVRAESRTGTKHQLIEIKPDRLPIGKHEKDKQPFTLNTLQLQKGDVIYTLTDGFPDQFGGANGKKFKSKQLQELLLSVASDPMEIQKQKLNQAFDNWKGNLEQVDDVCLIGIRV